MAKLSKSQQREAVFLLLYQSSLNDDSIEDILEINIAELELTADPVQTLENVKAVIGYAEKADEIIERYSKTRKVARMAKISLTVMRLAIYEMDCLSEEEVPDKVAINEAIELCKKYAGGDDYKFVSGILGSYYRGKNGNLESE